jgi:hypothetical protein
MALSAGWATGDAVTKAAVDTAGFVPEVWLS